VFITDKQSNYDRVCADLVATVYDTGAIAHADALGGVMEGDAARIPLFGLNCLVRPDGVFQNGRRLDTIGSILVMRYLLQAGSAKIRNLWLPYRDLKDGNQFASYIKAHIEDRIADLYSGKTALLRERLVALGARPHSGEMQSDLVLVVHPLPRVPVLCLFWDKDDEFPASCRFLFDASASAYLDLESLAATLQYIHLKITEDT
jgi:hypothetical protein